MAVKLHETSRWHISRADTGSDFYQMMKNSRTVEPLGTIADVKHVEKKNGPHNTTYRAVITFTDGTELTISDFDQQSYYLLRPDVELLPPSTIDPCTSLNDAVRYVNTLDWPNWTVLMDVVLTDFSLVEFNTRDEPAYSIWEHDPSGTFYRIENIKKVLPHPNNPQFFFQPAYEVPPETLLPKEEGLPAIAGKLNVIR
jgi:hypothetical protein